VKLSAVIDEFENSVVKISPSTIRTPAQVCVHPTALRQHATMAGELSRAIMAQFSAPSKVGDVRQRFGIDVVLVHGHGM